MKELNRLNIREISSSSVIFADGSMVAVLEVQPSFSKLGEKEKKQLIANYRLWLSSLDYPVQIIGRTVNMDADDRMMIFKAQSEHMLKRKKEHSETYLDFQRFFKWLDSVCPRKAERIYYVVIPFLPYYKSKRDLKYLANLKQHVHKLDERCMISKKLLQNCRLRVKRLNDKELIRLYSSYFIFSFHDKDYLTISDYIMKWREGS